MSISKVLFKLHRRNDFSSRFHFYIPCLTAPEELLSTVEKKVYRIPNRNGNSIVLGKKNPTRMVLKRAISFHLISNVNFPVGLNSLGILILVKFASWAGYLLTQWDRVFFG